MVCLQSNSCGIEYYVLLATSLLSIIGSGIIIALYIKFQELRAYSYKIVFHIAVADLLRSVISIIPGVYTPNKTVCIVYAILFHTFGIYPIIWSLSLSINFYDIILKGKTDFERHYRVWGVINYFFVPILHILPILTDSYGYLDDLCTFTDDADGYYWRFALFLVPAWVFIIAICLIYMLVLIKVRSIVLKTHLRHTVTRFMLYPIVIAILLLPLTVTRIVEAAVSNSGSKIFFLIAQWLFALAGFANFLLYGLTPHVKNVIKGEVDKRDSFDDEAYAKDKVNSSTSSMSEIIFLSDS